MSKDQWDEDEREPELIGGYEILHAIARGEMLMLRLLLNEC